LDWVDFDKRFDYENAFFLTAKPDRMSKVITRYELYKKIIGIPGEIVECGVFKGNGFAQWLKLRVMLEPGYSRRVIGFDTFDKVPLATIDEDEEPRRQFIEAAGDRSIALERLTDLLEKAGVNENVELVPGDICETAPKFCEQFPALRIALLIVDVDFYEPTRAALDAFFHRVVKGGVVLLDDFGAFEGANRAIEQHLGADVEHIERFPFSSSMPFIVVR